MPSISTSGKALPPKCLIESAGIPTDGAPARPAKQPAVGSGFNPNVIVERLG